MRRFMLLPGLMALTLIAVGCGGGDQADADKAEPGENAVAENAQTEESSQTEAKSVTQDDQGEPGATDETASTNPETPTEEKPVEADVSTAADKPAAKVGVQTSYLLEEAVAALIIHPRQLLAAPALADNPLIAARLEQAKQESGVNIANVEQIVISGGPGATPQEKPFSIVVRFADPHAGVEMVKTLASLSKKPGEVEEVTYEGSVYYRHQKDEAEEGDAADGAEEFGVQSPTPELPEAVFLPDNKTVVLGDEVWIQKLIMAKGVAKTPLTAALAEVESSSDVLFVLTVTEKLRQLANEATANNPNGPSPLDKFPDQLNQLVANISISPKILVNANLTLVDDKAADEVDMLINKSLEQGRKEMEGQLAFFEGAPPNDPSLIMLKELQKIFNGISTEKTGQNVRIDIGGLDQVNYQAIASGAMMMFMSGMGSGLGPGSGPPQDLDFPEEPAEEDKAEEAPAEPAEAGN